MRENETAAERVYDTLARETVNAALLDILISVCILFVSALDGPTRMLRVGFLPRSILLSAQLFFFVSIFVTHIRSHAQ